MDHAEAHELIADIALEPARLEALATASDQVSIAIRGHLETCEACRDELAALVASNRKVRLATGLDADDQRGRVADLAAESGPIAVPSGLKASILSRIGDEPSATLAEVARDHGRPAPPTDSRPPATTGRRPFGLARFVVAAAVVVVVAVGVAFGVGARGMASALDTARAGSAHLEAVAAALDRILSTPDHHSVVLFAADGTPGGTVSWSEADVVVLASSLPPPGPDRLYRCWIEQEGVRTPIGTMSVVDGTASWAAPLSRYGGALRSGNRLGVSLVSTDGKGDPQPVLVADL